MRLKLDRNGLGFGGFGQGGGAEQGGGGDDGEVAAEGDEAGVEPFEGVVVGEHEEGSEGDTGDQAGKHAGGIHAPGE